MTKLLTSWIASANSPDTEFPLNNLPYGVVDTGDARTDFCATAIGDKVLNLSLLEERGVLKPKWGAQSDGRPPLLSGRWNDFMTHADWDDYRSQLTAILSADGPGTLRENQELCAEAFSDLASAQMRLPFEVSEFTDFYAGKHHASNVGTMLRGAENALPPNWLHMPIGYNGRASSVVVSGTKVTRPWGQLKSPDQENPAFLPSRRFDFELELGAIVGRASEGPVSVAQADQNIFGYVLLNDWSARDIQAWEYQPLGPFQAKATATTISPWIVTRAALEPFRCNTPARVTPLLHHLEEPGPMLFDIDLAVELMPENGNPTTITRTNYREMYYSAAQQLCHHATSGCPMRVGDLLGSGTISGADKGSFGSMLELSWGGKEPVTLSDDVTRSFLENGDSVTFTGAGQGDGFKIGFGRCTGQIAPAIRQPFGD